VKSLFLLTPLLLASLTGAQTLQDLRHQYAVSNMKYFDNKLPKDTKIFFSRNLKNNSGLPSMAWTMCDHPVRLECTIKIDPAKSPTRGAAYMTLFHEMCHIKLWDDDTGDDHGPNFQACMTDLADRGAFRDWW